MTVQARRRLLGGTLITWSGGFHWQWRRVLVRVVWTEHDMPTRDP